jgi:GNAT superfamily N-acetyltransferase
MPTKHNDISLCVIHEEDISPELDRAIRETLVVCFPADREYFQRQSWWHCVPIYRVLGRDSKGSIVAHTAVVERTVIVGPSLSKVRVAGIQSCCVLPGHRGTGLSDKMMSVAMDEANRRGFDAGLLFCLDRLETVYGRMGWSRLDGAVYVADDKEGKALIPAKNITMFCPLKAKQFPAGDIDLVGTDW